VIAPIMNAPIACRSIQASSCTLKKEARSPESPPINNLDWCAEIEALLAFTDEVPNNGSHLTFCSMKRSALSPSEVEPELESLRSLYVPDSKL
jgi:hypothetical protein